ncbi:hypothetical protein FH972_022581 [Carpinus fangiana]|uniref:N-acetylglucosamine-induced protein 1 n=1 Tax=Carpinus fangiana TaxID=176857 RepID=A0A5N6KSN5_9ROSI|nr:hypothetical protein FH972_022581 [Carpinus fangiana]
MRDIAVEWGSVMKFILKQRVQWSDVSPRGGPFEFAEDYRVLYNDWPYGIDTRITHLVIWTKFGFEEDAATGDLTPAARKQIDDFVTRVFRKGDENGRENVMWFKNWAALKSVHAIEHFHVMLFDADKTFLREVTGDDRAMSEKIREAE